MGGMISATVLAIFYVPLFFVLVCGLFRVRQPDPQVENRQDLANAREGQ